MARNTEEDTPEINRNRTIWNLHPESPRVASEPKIPAADKVPLVAGTGEQQRALEDILSEVRASLTENRLIRIAGQSTAQSALKMFEKLPALEKRMNRVERIAIGATLINLILLLIASCR